MKVTKFDIPGLLLLEPTVFGDERGFFYESFNKKEFESNVEESVEFVQDNHSKSSKGVLRGLHYQLAPFGQGKLVRVSQGEVYDVAVDIRRSSPTFGNWIGVNLSAENKRQLWIPEGFAHGFLTLTNTAEFLYKTTQYYSPENERCIHWSDSTLNIQWPFDVSPKVSNKDSLGKPFLESEVYS